MAFLAPVIAHPFISAAVAASVVGSVASGISAINQSRQKPPELNSSSLQLPEQPKATDASAKAGVDLAKRRKISLLTGGQTDITRGQALVSSGNVGRKSLLGQ